MQVLLNDLKEREHYVLVAQWTQFLRGALYMGVGFRRSWFPWPLSSKPRTEFLRAGDAPFSAGEQWNLYGPQLV